MTEFAAALNTDGEGRRTTSEYGDPADDTADGSPRWYFVSRAFLRAEHAEDSAHASGDFGFMPLAVRQDVLAALAGTDGDYAAIKLDALGRLWVSGTVLEDAAHASGDPGHLALAVRRDTPAVSSGTDGDNSTLNVDAFGKLHVIQRPVSGDTTGWSRAKSTGAAPVASLVVKASAGRLRKVWVTSTLGSVQFLHVFNTASLPANATVPEHVRPIAANGGAELDLGELGDYYATGITVAVSTTADELTVGAADSMFSALYL